MTDLTTLTDMLDRAGIQWHFISSPEVKRKVAPGNQVVSISSVDDGKQDGYLGFWAEFEFTPDGALVGTGVWE